MKSDLSARNRFPFCRFKPRRGMKKAASRMMFSSRMIADPTLPEEESAC
ncbi:hypothetical protein [Rhizobium sp. No.120]